jgi:hypothetical protein
MKTSSGGEEEASRLRHRKLYLQQRQQLPWLSILPCLLCIFVLEVQKGPWTDMLGSIGRAESRMRGRHSPGRQHRSVKCVESEKISELQ